MKFLPQATSEAHALKCELAGEVLRSSGSLRVRVTGWSMLPTIWPGDTLVIEPATSSGVVEGDIVLFDSGRRFVAHRVVSSGAVPGDAKVQTQGDAVPRPDAPVSGNLLGKVSYVVRNGKRIEPSRSLRRSERAFAALFRKSKFAARVAVGVHGMRTTSLHQVEQSL